MEEIKIIQTMTKRTVKLHTTVSEIRKNFSESWKCITKEFGPLLWEALAEKVLNGVREVSRGQPYRALSIARL